MKTNHSDEYIVWHKLFGFPVTVTKDTLFLINLFRHSRTVNSVLEEYDVDNKNIFNQLILSYYLIPESMIERSFLGNILKQRIEKILDGSAIDFLELRVSEACNFACEYCIHQNLKITKKQRSNLFMNLETAKKSTDIYFNLLKAQNKDFAEITFGGAEPMLNWKTIIKTIYYIKKVYGRKFRFQFYINTNFSLITPEIAKIIKKYDIDVFPSIDGPKEANNKVRVTKMGKGTFHLIMKAIKYLKNTGVSIRGISATANDNNFFDLDEYFLNWASDNKFKKVNINIDAINGINSKISEITSHLLRLIKYGEKIGLEISGFWRRPAENLVESLINYRLGFCGAVRGDNLCVDPIGNIRSCGYSNIIIGNIHRFDHFFDFNGAYHEFLLNNAPTAPDMCKGCMLEGPCGGGCIITREFNKNGSSIDKLKKICEFYRIMTKKILLSQYISLKKEIRHV